MTLRRLTTAMLPLLLGGVTLAAAEPPVVLKTSGLVVTLDLGTSRVTALRCGGKDIASGGPGGFFVQDFAAGTAAEAAVGANRLLAPEAKIEVLPTFQPRPDHLAVHATVRDLTGQDRALIVSFRLPISTASGNWSWDDDLRAARPISREPIQPGTMVVGGNDSAGVDTPRLTQGQTYTLTASGAAPVAMGYGKGPQWWGDAEWADYYEGTGYPDGPRLYHEENPFGDANCWDLLVDGQPVEWLGSADGQNWTPHTYSPDHVYRYEIIGQGKPINLKRLDNMRDGRSGSLSVTISPLPEGPIPPRRYETVEPLSWDGKYSLQRFVSRYPFCSLRNQTAGLALAVPVSQPRVHRCSFIQTAQGQGYLEVAFELGLSPDLKRSPSTATVEFVIYPTDPQWGMRSAAQRYYGIYPESFATGCKRHGIWLLGMDPEAVTEPWDFGFRFHETGTDKDEPLIYDANYGIESYHYIEAGGLWTGFHGHDDTATSTPYPQEAGLSPKQLTEEWLSRRANEPKLFDALSACAAHDVNGDWIWLRWTNEYPGTGPRASHSTCMMNPDIPGGYGRMYLDGCLRVFDEAAERGVPVDGIYQDSISMYIAMFPENYRRELWAYTDVPLTFSHLTAKPVQLHHDGMWEFSDELSRGLRRRGKLMMANTYRPADRFFYPFLDMFGTETAGGTGNDASYLRLYGYQKPISYLDYFMLGSEAHPPPDDWDRERAMNVCLLWGIFPGTADFTVKNQSRIEMMRPIFRRYIPLITEVAEAGWEPITRARCADENVMIERFGDLQRDGRMYLTVMANVAPESGAAEIIIPAAMIGNGKREVCELVTDELLPLRKRGGDYVALISLPQKERTRIIRIATPNALAKLALQQADDHIANVAAHLRWTLRSAPDDQRPPLEQALRQAEALLAAKAASLAQRERQVQDVIAAVQTTGLSERDAAICARQYERAAQVLREGSAP